MRKSNRDIRTGYSTPVLGFAIVVLTAVCVIFGLWLVMIITRLVIG